MNHRIIHWGWILILIVMSTVTTAAAQSLPMKLITLNHQELNLQSLRGRVVVLVFGSTTNPMSDKSLPALQRLVAQYRSSDVVFYWVSIDSDVEDDARYVSDSALKQFALGKGFQATILRDANRAVFHSLHFDSLPSAAIIDRRGNVYQKEVGFNPESARGYSNILKSLNHLLSESEE